MTPLLIIVGWLVCARLAYIYTRHMFITTFELNWTVGDALKGTVLYTLLGPMGLLVAVILGLAYGHPGRIDTNRVLRERRK